MFAHHLDLTTAITAILRTSDPSVNPPHIPILPARRHLFAIPPGKAEAIPHVGGSPASAHVRQSKERSMVVK